jgi:hypothetical protein
MGNDWFISIETIREAFETNVFRTPGTIAKLPNALGGDPKRSDALRRTLVLGPYLVVNKDAFFELLWSKAHFLMLPKPIVTFLRDSSRVSVTEALPERATAEDKWYTTCTPSTDPSGKMAILQVPGVSDALSKVGCCLGRECETEDPYDALATLYHEMTHAWLCLQEFSDADIQNLYNDGSHAYEGSSGANGTTFDSHVAFSEAAAAYVEERISRWCKALWDVSWVLQLPNVRQWKVSEIVTDYNADLWKHGKVAGERITSPPELPQELRDAIDRKILDGLSLTNPLFNDTLLARVLNPLLPNP